MTYDMALTDEDEREGGEAHFLYCTVLVASRKKRRRYPNKGKYS